MTKQICIIAGLLMMLCSRAYGQEYTSGKVLDADTNNPIQGAVITNLNNRESVFSDKNGEFILNEKADSIEVSAFEFESLFLSAEENHLIIRLYREVQQLSEVTITANRVVQKRSEVPVAIDVISKKEIENTKATRLDMLLNKVPGVFMTDLGNEQHNMAVRQPMGYNNLFLYLEDGVPIRTVGDFNHNALIEINHASMDRIEVIRGPASSLYGSEAVGGALNFITKKPTRNLSGKVQGEIGTRGYKRTDMEIGGTTGKLGLYLGGYYANQDRKVSEHNDFDKLALTLRGDYKFNEKSTWTTVADLIRYNTDQIGGLDSLHFYTKDYQSRYRFTYRKVDAFRLRTTLDQHWNLNSHTNFTLLYRHSAIGQNPFYNIADDLNNPLKAKGEINKDAFNGYGGIVQHTQTLEKLNSKVIIGASFDYNPATYNAKFIRVDKDELGNYIRYEATDSLLTDYKVNLVNTAVYAQWEYNPLKKLRTVAAFRYDRLDYDFINHLPPGAFSGAPSSKNHFSHFTPKVGLTYEFSRNRDVYVNYSVGFAPPNISDLYHGVQVPVLKPSSYDNYEVGGWFGFDNSKAYLEVSLYQLTGKNEIVSQRLIDGSQINQNAGETSHKGIELNLKYKVLRELDFRIGGTIAKHKFIDYVDNNHDYSGNEMPQAPSYMLNGEITWHPNFLSGFRLGLEMQSLGSYYTDPQNTAKYDGFTVFNLRTGYRYQQWEVWANWTNVFDKNYAVTVEKSAWGTTYRPGELTTFTFGAAWHFGK